MSDYIFEGRQIRQYFPIKDILGRKKSEVKAVDGVSIGLKAGETYGLVGETGCGKSTLGRTMLKLLEPTSGQIFYRGEEITSLKVPQMRRYRQELQMIFQDPYTSLNPRKRVGQILEEVLAIHGMNAGRQETVMEILARVGLRKEFYYRYPNEMSGGQRQRVGIARSLLLNPSVIVCDEPVSALDVSIQSQIINLLLDLQQERNISYLFIAHDMSVVKYISNRIGVMYLGNIVEEASTDELFGMAMHPYTQALLSAVPSTNPHIRKQRIVLEGDVPSPISPPTGCVFHTRCPYAMPICSQEKPEWQKINEGHCVACHLYQAEARQEGEQM